MGIHFLISQIVATVGLLLIVQVYGLPNETIYQYTILMTGITALLAMLPSLYFYRRDKVCRMAGGVIPSQSGSSLNWKEGVLLLITGAGLAQYGNLIAGLLQIFLKSTVYQESMDKITEGKSFLMLVFWMGIIAPIVEEIIFRWLIYLRLRDYLRVTGAAAISALIFGIYHGNVIQAVYASLLGVAFAYILEASGNLWSCVLLHIGANIWSLILSEYGERILKFENGPQILLVLYLVLLAGVIGGISHFINKGNRRKFRAV